MVALQYYSHRLCVQQGNPVQVYVGYGVLVVLFEFYIKSTLLRGIQIQMAKNLYYCLRFIKVMFYSTELFLESVSGLKY